MMLRLMLLLLWKIRVMGRMRRRLLLLKMVRDLLLLLLLLRVAVREDESSIWLLLLSIGSRWRPAHIAHTCGDFPHRERRGRALQIAWMHSWTAAAAAATALHQSALQLQTHGFLLRLQQLTLLTQQIVLLLTLQQ